MTLFKTDFWRTRVGLLALLVVACAVWLVGTARAADTNHYPATLVDQSCTDDHATPAHAAPPLATIGILGAYFPHPTAQSAGSSDGYCDNDPYLITGAITADTNFGPFYLDPSFRGLWIFIETSAVTGGSADWSFSVSTKRPHDATLVIVDTTSTQTGASGTYVFMIGGSSVILATGWTQELKGTIPQPFYLHLELVSATSWTGEISLVPWR